MAVVAVAGCSRRMRRSRSRRRRSCRTRHHPSSGLSAAHTPPMQREHVVFVVSCFLVVAQGVAQSFCSIHRCAPGALGTSRSCSPPRFRSPRAGPWPQAAPSAHARLASVAKQHPRRKVVAIAQFKAGVSERRARALVRSHHGRVTDRLPAVNGLAIRLPARQARALRRSKRVLNVTLNTARAQHRRRRRQPGDELPEDHRRGHAVGRRHHRQGRRRRRHRLRRQRRPAGLQERRRQLAHHGQRDRQPGRDPPRRRGRPRHARRRHHRGQLVQSRSRRPGARRLRRHRPRGRPDRDQGRRRRRRLDRARRHHGAAVRRRAQGRRSTSASSTSR